LFCGFCTVNGIWRFFHEVATTNANSTQGQTSIVANIAVICMFAAFSATGFKSAFGKPNKTKES
jgi:hypothetical protein